MLKHTGILVVVLGLLAIAPAFAATDGDTGAHVYAAIADRVASGEISCACPDVSEMAIGNCGKSLWDRHFSGLVRLRWQLADNARNTGLVPWGRVEINYHSNPWKNVEFRLGVGGDTQTDSFFPAASFF